jgi:hypothetical protein
LNARQENIVAVIAGNHRAAHIHEFPQYDTVRVAVPNGLAFYIDHRGYIVASLMLRTEHWRKDPVYQPQTFAADEPWPSDEEIEGWAEKGAI